MARLFTRASNHSIRFIPGLVTGSLWADRTVVAILRRASNQGASDAEVFCVNFATDINGSMLFGGAGGTDKLSIKSATGAGIQNAPTITVVTANGWHLVAIGKTSGTTTPRYHRYVYNTGVWTHENGSGTFNEAASGGTNTTAEIGSILVAAGESFDGDIAVVGVFPGVLSDTQIESMPFTLTAWYALSPQALWVLDQHATSQAVPDLSGNGSQQSGITGTAVSSVNVPVFNRHGQLLMRAYRLPEEAIESMSFGQVQVG